MASSGAILLIWHTEIWVHVDVKVLFDGTFKDDVKILKF